MSLQINVSIAELCKGMPGNWLVKTTILFWYQIWNQNKHFDVIDNLLNHLTQPKMLSTRWTEMYAKKFVDIFVRFKDQVEIKLVWLWFFYKEDLTSQYDVLWAKHLGNIIAIYKLLFTFSQTTIPLEIRRFRNERT